MIRTGSSGDIHAFSKKILEFSDLELDELVARIPNEMAVEVGESLCDFFTMFGGIKRFNSWAIRREVENTKHFGELFRDNRLSVTILKRSMFDDNGVKYLTSILSGLFKDVISFGKTINISSFMTEKEVVSNTNYLLKYLDSFFEVFGRNLSAFPSNVKEILIELNSVVLSKFPENKFFALNFLFFYFICPAILHPKKTGVFKKAIPDFACQSFITFSRILNDVATLSYEKHQNGEIKEYILKKNPEISAQVLSLIERSFDKSEKDATFSKEEQLAAATSLRRVLNEAFTDTLKKESIDLSPDSPEMFQQKLKVFIEKINNSNWKKTKDKKNYTVYALKDPDSKLVALKATTTVKSTLENIESTYRKVYLSEKWSEFLESYETLKKSDNFLQTYVVHRLPFPLTTRDSVYNDWTFHVEDETSRTLYLMIEGVHSAPRKPGYVRAKVWASGWVAVQEKSNPENIQLTYILHASLGGSVPNWTVNQMNKYECKKVIRLAKVLETGKYEDGQPI